MDFLLRVVSFVLGRVISLRSAALSGRPNDSFEKSIFRFPAHILIPVSGFEVPLWDRFAAFFFLFYV